DAVKSAQVKTQPAWIVEIARARVHSSGPNQKVADMELDFLPSVDQAVEWPRFGIRRRRLRTAHVTDHAHPVRTVVKPHLRRNVNLCVAPDRSPVDVAEMAEVEQIV